MPNPIDTRISLSGIDDARAKLNALGADGEKALGKINQSTAGASAGTSQFSAALDELAAKFGIPVDAAEKFGEALKGFDFEGGIAGLGALAGAIVAAGVAFIALAEHAATATREIANHAATLGVTAEAFEGLQFAAASVGISAETAVRGLDRFWAKIGQAREEQAKLAGATDMASAAIDKQDRATAARRAIGVGRGTMISGPTFVPPRPEAFDTVKDMIDQVAARGGDAVQSLSFLADRFNAISDPAEKAALGLKVFGKGWGELAPLLALGSKALEEHAAEWKRLEITATPAEEKMAGAYAAAFSKLELVIGGLTNAVGNIIGELFTPGMEALTKALSGAQAQIREFASGVVEHLRPVMEIGSQVFRGFIDALNDMTAIINRVFGSNFSTVMVVATAALSAFARPLVVITGAFLLVEAAIKGVFGPNSDIDAGKVAGYVVAFGGLVVVIKNLTTAMWALGAAIYANPIVLIIGAVIALTAAVAVINGDMKGLSDVIRKYIGDDAAKSFDGFVETVRGGWEGLKTFMAKTFQEWTAAFDDWLANSESAAAGVLRLILQIATGLGLATASAAQAKAATSAAAAWGGGDSAPDTGPITAARGGRVPGRGFGDIVRALLTPGEFVHRVAAVNYYGVNAMRRINNLEVPRFELGGLVGALQDSFTPTQHFAEGGMVGATAPGAGGRASVHLHLDGQQYIMQTDAETAAQIERAARSQATRSTGRKPSSYVG